MPRTPIAIASLRHRVLLCRQDDVAITGGTLQLRREGVWPMWASIDPSRSSGFTPQGQSWAMRNERNVRTHRIMTRYHPDLLVSTLAWIYEERLRSAPRWFKILKINETEEGDSPFFKFDCRIIERGEDLIEPSEPVEEYSPVTGLPEGVKL